MAYGIIKVDTITFTDGGVDKSVSISGLVQNPTFSGNITVTGTISGNLVQGQTISGVTVTGTTAQFTSGTFTSITGGVATITSGVFASGTAAAPSVSVGTTTNGLYSPATNQIAITTSGTGRLLIDSSGRVGIGTTSPFGKLHVQDDSSDLEMFLIGPSAGSTRIRFGDSADTNIGQIIYDNTSDSLQIHTNNAERARIDSSGRLGVGTSSPSATLHVNGSTTVSSEANVTARIGPNVTSDVLIGSLNGNTPFIASQGAYALQLRTNATAALTIDSSQRVGIGTTSPIAPLHLYGGSGQTTANLTDAGDRGGFLRLSVNNSLAGSGGALIFSNGQGDAANSVGFAAIKGLLNDGSNNTAGHIAFSTRGSSTDSALSERLRIDSSGRVGIGTTGPSFNLDVSGSGTQTIRAITTDVSGTAIGRFRAVYTGGGGGTQSAIDLRAGDAYGYLTTEGSVPLLFGVNLQERARITSAGDVGIGIAAPNSALHIYRASATSVYITTSNTAGTWLTGIAAGGDYDIYSNNASNIKFSNNATERARIDSSGRLLVGTALPLGGTNSTVQIAGTTSSAGLQITRFNSSDGCIVDFSSNRNATVNIYTTAVSGDELARLRFLGYDGANQQVAAQITAVVDGTPGVTDMPGRLVFSTTPDGTSSPTERLRITNDGVMCYDQAAPVSYAAAATLVVGDLKNGLVQYTGAAATLTLPTGTLTEGGFAASSVYTNMTFEWSVINTGSGTCTIGAGTGHTIVGGATVAAGASGRFASRRTAANTFVSYRLS